MKKIFTFLLIALVAFGASALEQYNLEICGVRVTSDNAQNLTQILTEKGYLQSGTVSFSVYRLSLNNAVISSPDKDIIRINNNGGSYTEVNSFEIFVNGNCELETNASNSNLSCITSAGSVNAQQVYSFTGNGSLAITSGNIAFMTFNKSYVLYRFNGPDVTVNGGNYGIYSTSTYDVKYEMLSGSLTVNSNYRAIWNYFNFEEGISGVMEFGDGMEIMEPEGGHLVFDPTAMSGGVTIQDGNNQSASHVKIGVRNYPLTVGGVQVTSKNRDDILGDGKVYYNPSTNTLTLNNATISSERQVIISDIAGLHLELLGENHIITQRNVYGLYFLESDGVVIDGGGSLSMESAVNQVSIGYFTHRADAPAHTTIRNCSITTPGGVIQNEDNDCSLTVDNAYIYIGDGYFCTPPMLTLNNCHISKPEGGHVNDYGQICASGSNDMYWGEIEIMPGSAPLPVIVGDVNGDGEVTASDVTALYNYLLNDDDSSLVYGDQNNDGSITSSDVTTVYNVLLGN
jgi:hypothetical protein